MYTKSSLFLPAFSIAILCHLSLCAQLVPNGTFFGLLNTGNLPDDWQSCEDGGFISIEPGAFHPDVLAYEGETFLGMNCRGTNDLTANLCAEINTTLSAPLDPADCYELEIFLAFDPNIFIPDWRNPIYLDVFLSRNTCQEEFRVARFGPIEHADWRAYQVSFAPTNPYTEIWVKASYGDNRPYDGHLLADQLSIQRLSLPTLDLGPDRSLCPGEVAILDATQTGASYQWQDGSTAPTFTASESGTYLVTVTYACGARQADRVEIVDPSPPLVFEPAAEVALCPGDSLLLQIDTSLYDDFRWQDSIRSASFLVTAPGVYELQTTSVCGTARERLDVVQGTPPRLSLGADTTLCPGNALELRVPAAITDFQWEDGTTVRERPITRAGTYRLTAANACGTTEDEIVVETSACDCFMYFPNAFSPNRDGVNDRFTPGFVCELETYELDIFDRWGNQVFAATSTFEAWDGTFRAQAAPTGVYLYTARYRFAGRPDEQAQGMVTLVR